MKYLIQGGESAERMVLLLRFTKICSPQIIAALNDHFVTGHQETRAAIRNGVKESNLTRAINTLEDTAHNAEMLKELDWVKFGYKFESSEVA
ncbi:PapB/FocB family fimbrial expression transcriptional regulator [Shewanella sp. TB4-MNA-CIBAN-0142]|uniref:PapB/FocB family fimbrial expression transcriptional regulator n=1 Tax=Shewanella sp. TB4-MNA-CIBAN-0142 TaxID=3140464 RepID=UPI00331EA853